MPFVPFQKFTVAVSPFITREPLKLPKVTFVSASPLARLTTRSSVVRTHPDCTTSATSHVPVATPVIL